MTLGHGNLFTSDVGLAWEGGFNLGQEHIPRSLSLVAVVGLASILIVSGLAAPATKFSQPLRLFYQAGDDWEPYVAADGTGNVYVTTTHYGGVAGCSDCPRPVIMMQISRNDGQTFGAPFVVAPWPGAHQFDPQVVVNSDGSVWVSMLNYHDNRGDTIVSVSRDRGATWSAPVAVNDRAKATDKDWLAVKGNDAYVAYETSSKNWVSHSHDGGATWTEVQVDPNENWNIALAAGAVIDSKGNYFVAWDAVRGNQNTVDLRLSKTTDGGKTWVNTLVATVGGGVPCELKVCGWEYFSAQNPLAIDASDRLYMAWGGPIDRRASPIMYYATSSDGGMSWSPATVVNSDETSAYHLFPALVAGAPGEVHLTWMDNRTGNWNVWYRTSSDGGNTWSPEMQVSQYDPSYSYSHLDGFTFPYGDYYGIALDSRGHIHIAWGEGPNWLGPGNTYYSHT